MSPPTTFLSSPPVRRPLALLAAGALVAVAVVHLIDGPSSLQDTGYLGALELALAAACLPLAALLLICPVRGLWVSAAALIGGALVVYVASRTVGLPGDSDDIGNWWQATGVANVIADLLVLGPCAAVLVAPARHLRLRLRTA